MQKTKIEWTDYVFNPIKGLCPVNCKLPDGRSYCYARAMYKRFKWNPEVKYGVTCSEYKQLRFLKPGTKVFVCSTFELFHPSVKKEWRDWIFDVIEYNNRHTFQILTKMPENIDRRMPDNVHLGVSAGDDLVKSAKRVNNFFHYIMQNEGFYFLSLEPMIFSGISQHSFENIFPLFGWIIVGRLTGHGKKYDPPRKDIENIVDSCQELQIPIFLKNNLKDIWGEKLIQEFPGRKDPSG